MANQRVAVSDQLQYMVPLLQVGKTACSDCRSNTTLAAVLKRRHCTVHYGIYGESNIWPSCRWTSRHAAPAAAEKPSALALRRQHRKRQQMVTPAAQRSIAAAPAQRQSGA